MVEISYKASHGANFTQEGLQVKQNQNPCGCAFIVEWFNMEANIRECGQMSQIMARSRR